MSEDEEDEYSIQKQVDAIYKDYIGDKRLWSIYIPFEIKDQLRT